MVFVEVACPFCASTNVVKRGKTSNGKQRYECRNEACDHSTFILDYSYLGCLPDIKDRILDMAVNANGIRDTARVLNIAIATVLSTLRLLENNLESINIRVLENPDCYSLKVLIVKVELDEMWALWDFPWHYTAIKTIAYLFYSRIGS